MSKNNMRMTSASKTSAKNLFSDSKRKLCDRVQGNLIALQMTIRQISRGSRTSENLQKMQLLSAQFGYQYESISQHVENLTELKEHAEHIGSQI
ncbi:uncharacterized protein LOC136026538 isoform X3 [Artemia franciscana]|uniref:uncharacterized protein LOC136026538 isoform X3 n=1 Tax=Artemia franciscana TaxID=6661 RepID=UPI0032DB4BE2